MNPIRSLAAVLAGMALMSVVVELLEFTLVNAVTGGAVTDMAGYLAARNRPTILAAKVVYNPVAALLGGYVTARIAGGREMLHGGVGAAAQTVALIWGFTAGEFASSSPVWIRIVLVLITGPAMLVGASIRARAARSET